MALARVLGARAARPLDGVWEIASLAPGQAAQPADLNVLAAKWIACAEALPVAAALAAAGDEDLEQSRDLDANDWWYRCRFSSPSRPAAARLRFDGLATIADVWL